MRQLVPHFILSRYTSGQQQGRLRAAVLLLDISAFTHMTDTLMQYGQEAAEDLADLIQVLFDPLVEAVYRHGGFVGVFGGDAFTAIFPRTEVDETHALAAAAEIREHVTGFGQQVTSYGALDLAVKLSLATGDVAWGILPANDNAGSEGHHAYYFAGEAVSDCLAVAEQLTAGQLALTPSFYQTVTRLVRGEWRSGHYLVQDVVAAAPPPLPPPQPVKKPFPFVPASIHQQTERGEFRQLASVFINVHAPAGHEELTVFYRTLTALQSQYGGYVNTVEYGPTGFRFLLFWGVPTSYENDVQRALSLLLALRNQSALTFRAALTYRAMYAGFVGAARRQEYSGYGQGINLAARLVTAASWDAIWLDEPAAHRATRHFHLEPLGKLALKGFDAEQPAFLLTGLRRGHSSRFYRGALVGRAVDVEYLNAFLRPLIQGRYAGVLTVIGEAGIGKSRLLYHVRKQWQQTLTPNAPQWFFCPGDETIPQSLHPFRYALRRYFRQHAREGTEVNRRRFAERLADLRKMAQYAAAIELGAELQRTQPFLAALVGLESADPLYQQSDGRRRLENSFSALRTLLLLESRLRPLVIQLEDVQWLDDDSISFIQDLTRASTTYPLAIVATARPGATRWQQEIVSEKWPLNRLDAGALDALATNLLNGCVAPSLTELLAERSEGNPFFAEQIVFYLQEQQLLVSDDSGALTAAVLPDWALPRDVRALLISRVDSLPVEVRDLVQMAATLGREFDATLLAQMVDEEWNLAEKLEVATRAGIWTPLTEIDYLFQHILLRDAAYEMQLKARRRALHLRAARVIEQLYRDDLGGYYSDLAYHYEQAALPQRAARWYQRAGEHAAANYISESAIYYLSRALALLPPDDAVRRFSLLNSRELAYDLVGAREAQANDLAALEQLARRLGPQAAAQVALRRANYAHAVGDYGGAATAARTVIELDASPPSEAAAYWEWGKALWRQNKYVEARKRFMRALRLARQLGDMELLGRALNGLGMVADSEGDYERAERYYRLALRQQEVRGDLAGQSMSYNNLGYISFMQGLFVDARRYFDEALQLNRELGDRHSQSTALNNLGIVSMLLGDREKAGGWLEQGLRLSREVDNHTGAATLLSNLALLRCQEGRHDDALGLAQEALAATRVWGLQGTEAEALTHLGHALAGRGELQEAEAAYRGAVTLWQELGRDHMSVEARAGLIEIVLQQEKGERAREQAHKTVTLLREGVADGVMELLRVYLACYRGLHASGDELAREVLSEAYELLQHQAGRLGDEKARRLFLEVPAHRSIQTLWSDEAAHNRT